MGTLGDLVLELYMYNETITVCLPCAPLEIGFCYHIVTPENLSVTLKINPSTNGCGTLGLCHCQSGVDFSSTIYAFLSSCIDTLPLVKNSQWAPELP